MLTLRKLFHQGFLCFSIAKRLQATQLMYDPIINHTQDPERVILRVPYNPRPSALSRQSKLLIRRRVLFPTLQKYMESTSFLSSKALRVSQLFVYGATVAFHLGFAPSFALEKVVQRVECRFYIISYSLYYRRGELFEE